MDYSQFEMKLCDKLVQVGWILSWYSDRTDTHIKWSELGETHKATFVADVNEVFPCHTDELMKLLVAFGHYHGMIEMSEIEKIRHQVSYMISDEPFLLIICDRSGHAQYALFQSREDDAAYESMLAAVKEDKEIIIIESCWLREAKMSRLTPFGARGYWVKK